MKTQMGLYLGVGTAEELRNRASATGAPVSDLADLVIRFGLARMTDESIRAWVARQAPTRGRLAGGLRLHERACIGAIDRLKLSQAPAWRFSGSDIANEASLKLTEAFWALKSLQTRGLVVGAELEELDRWGRPVKSFWCLTSDSEASRKSANSAAR